MAWLLVLAPDQGQVRADSKQCLLGSAGFWGGGSWGRSGRRSIGFGGLDMHSVSAVLFTAHVQAVAAFTDHIQSQARKDHESNNNFPHDSSPIMKKALHRGKAQNVAPESPRDAYKINQSSA